MSPLELVVAAVALVAAVGVGTVVHECLHAAVLRAAGVPHELEWLGRGRSGRLGAGVSGTWASVRLLAVPESLPAWQLRAASLAPLAMAVPLLAIPLGPLPDPVAGGPPALQLAVVGWLACALPSPADFSLVWHAESVIDGAESAVPA